VHCAPCVQEALWKSIIVHRNVGAALLVGTLSITAVLTLRALYKENCALESYRPGVGGQCTPPAGASPYMTSVNLGELLSSLAVPSIFEWYVPISLAVLLLQLLLCKAFFHLRFRSSPAVPRSFSLNAALSDPRNDAVAVSFAAACAAAALTLCGVVTCPDPHVGRFVLGLLLWLGIGLGLVVASLCLNTLAMLHTCRSEAALVDNNLAVAAFEAGSTIAAGLVVKAAVTGDSPSFGVGLATTLLYWSVAQAFMLAAIGLHRLLTRFDLQAAIAADGNFAAGVSSGMTLVALAVVVHTGVLRFPSLAVLAPVVAAGLLLLYLLRVLVDRFILPGGALDDEVSRDKNWGAALIEGTCAVSVALILTMLMPVEPGADVCD